MMEISIRIKIIDVYFNYDDDCFEVLLGGDLVDPSTDCVVGELPEKRFRPDESLLLKELLAKGMNVVAIAEHHR